MQEAVRTMSNLQKDFVASFLRSQAEKELHRFRKLCVSN